MKELVAHRRLSKILMADAVGYSRLMGLAWNGTLAELKALRADLVAPLTEKHGGRIVKLMGDGALIEFDSVVEAVVCAIAIQRGIGARNAALGAADASSSVSPCIWAM